MSKCAFVERYALTSASFIQPDHDPGGNNVFMRELAEHFQRKFGANLMPRRHAIFEYLELIGCLVFKFSVIGCGFRCQLVCSYADTVNGRF